MVDGVAHCHDDLRPGLVQRGEQLLLAALQPLDQRRERLGAVPAVALGQVQGLVGRHHELLHPQRVLRVGGDADAESEGLPGNGGDPG